MICSDTYPIDEAMACGCGKAASCVSKYYEPDWKWNSSLRFPIPSCIFNTPPAHPSSVYCRVVNKLVTVLARGYKMLITSSLNQNVFVDYAIGANHEADSVTNPV